MKDWLITTAKRALRAVGYDLRKSRFAYLDPYADIARMLADVPEPVIFDIGANRGETIAEFRKLLPASHVHAFEPTPDLLAGLRARFKDDTHVIINAAAVSDRDGTTSFYVRDYDQMNSTFELDHSTAKEHGVKDTGAMQVKTITLSNYCKSGNLTYAHAVKIDIEGAEKLALAGAQSLLKDHAIGIIFLEIHCSPLFRDQTTLRDVETILRGNGYEIYGIYEINRLGSGAINYFNMMYLSPQKYQALPPHALF